MKPDADLDTLSRHTHSSPPPSPSTLVSGPSTRQAALRTQTTMYIKQNTYIHTSLPTHTDTHTNPTAPTQHNTATNTSPRCTLLNPPPAGAGVHRGQARGRDTRSRAHPTHWHARAGGGLDGASQPLGARRLRARQQRPLPHQSPPRRPYHVTPGPWTLDPGPWTLDPGR
eukprot:1203149-Rhodomonas_salina.2